MELTLTHQSNTQVAVACDGQPSHTFDLRQLVPDENVPGRPPQPLADPVVYGRAVHQALFPPDTPAAQALAAGPERILLVATDPSTSSGQALQAVPWEYAYGDDFLVLDCPFVRGLPPDRRIAPPALDAGLHIVAVPSNPLDKDVPPLNIDGEWLRLQEIIQAVPQALTLERTRPPTLEQLRRLLANQRQRVLHFMGHGGQHEGGAVLLFENEHGGLAPVTTRDLLRRVKGTIFLATLNACVSATPGPTEFDNLAAALVRQGTPYALGMRFSIIDDDARAFSRVLYSELARGTDVERAVHQARLALDGSVHRWAVGVPVLYTALNAPAPGFAPRKGAPRVLEHQPKLEIGALPRADGAFQGRVEELKDLGRHLTGDHRPRLLTIHGGGGQGKTALALEAVERFAHAWPGGVWAISLENLPSKALFVADLARFLGVPTGEIGDPAEVERQMLTRLGQRRALLVLDNAETLLEQVEANNKAALELAQFIRQNLPGPRVSLLTTSRYHLGWTGEISLELGGLAPDEGTRLFRQSTPQRWVEAGGPLAGTLSEKVDGHPLSLRLLGGAFNAIDLSLEAFSEQYEQALIKAKDKWLELDHRHRTLYASIETSARYLDDALRDLLSGLWIFHASFLPETATVVLDPTSDSSGCIHESERKAKNGPLHRSLAVIRHVLKRKTVKKILESSKAAVSSQGLHAPGLSPVPNQLDTLWHRGLLTREARTLRDGEVLLYRLPSALRPYAERHLSQAHEGEVLRARFGAAYADLARHVYREMNRSAVAAYVAQQAREDLERGVACVQEKVRGYYLLHWGGVLKRLGDTGQALRLTESALESAQGQDQRLMLEAMNNMALVHSATGQPGRALELFQDALPIRREMEDRAWEAVTLNNLGEVYYATGQPGRALELFQEALPIMRDVGYRAGEAATLNNMAAVHQATGQPGRALELFQEALPIRREVGDRVGEAATLNNMAAVHRATGQPGRALELYQEALPIRREVGDRVGEATTLNNMGEVYRAKGQPARALDLFQEALSISREVGDRVGEAATLNNMGEVYRAKGQPGRVLELYQEALPIFRDVGDRAGEAATLNNTAAVYFQQGAPDKALDVLRKIVPIAQEIGDRATEAGLLHNIATVLLNLNRKQEAIIYKEQAVAVLEDAGLSHAAGSKPLLQIKEELARMQGGANSSAPPGGSSTMPAEQI